MRVGFTLARVGPIPPPGGPTRVAFLQERGRRAIAESARELAKVEVSAGRHIEIDNLPYLTAGDGTADLDDRIADWNQRRAALVSALPQNEYVAVERAPRRALAAAVDAFRDLEACDKGAAAHRRLHHLGQMVNGLFLCTLRYDEDARVWFERCPVDLSHTTLGASPGFTADHLCSLCGQDITACPHFMGVDYIVPAATTVDGLCNICGAETCSHRAGEHYPARMRVVVANQSMHEASFVHSPREPRARATEIEIRDQPPKPRTASSRRRCVACLLGCPGPRGGTSGTRPFTSPERFVQRAVRSRSRGSIPQPRALLDRSSLRVIAHRHC